MNIIIPTKHKTYSDASISILQDTLNKVREIYEGYYHFDKVFVCVDEHTMQVIDYDYDGEGDE